MNILVVEDTEDSRLLLEDELKLKGYEVESAEDGVDALIKAKRSAPDIIVSDILMPNMDGFEFFRQLKKDTQLSKIPFIFYTATYTSPEDEQFALSLGVSRFILKPSNISILTNAIEEVIHESGAVGDSITATMEITEEQFTRFHMEALARKLDDKVKDLQHQKEELRIIADALPVLISKNDEEGKFVFINKTYGDWFHTSRDFLIGKQFKDIMIGKSYQLIKEHLDIALRGQYTSIDILLPFPGGVNRYIYMQFIPNITSEGVSKGFFTLASDITKNKEEELELLRHRENLEKIVNERTAQLKESNEELKAFSYSVSHDLRAPLRSINNFSATLLEDYSEELTDEAQGFLNRIHRASQHMQSLINDLLALSKITRRELINSQLNLSDIAREAHEALLHKYPDHDVSFECENNLMAEGDPGLMRIALDNLLDNAWKYSANSSPAVVKLFSKKNKDDETVFCVEDNGIGFDMRYVDKIFDAFQRLHSTDEYPGTGIGLAIVRRIILRHGGKVWVESKINIGTSFYFTLPKKDEID